MYNLPFNFVYQQQLSSRFSHLHSMTASPGTSAPTLFGFTHPISGLCGISSHAHELMCCLHHCFLGTSTATLFGAALNRLKHLQCLSTALTSLPCRLLSATSLFHANTPNQSHTSYHTPCHRTCGTGVVLSARALARRENWFKMTRRNTRFSKHQRFSRWGRSSTLRLDDVRCRGKECRFSRCDFSSSNGDIDKTATRKSAHPIENIDRFEDTKKKCRHGPSCGRGDKRVGLLPMRHIQGHTDQWLPHAITDGTSGRDQRTRRV